MSNTTPSKPRLVQSLATASGALAASVAATQASTVQITLTGNKLTTSINTLNADLTGDGTADIAFGSTGQRIAGSLFGVSFKLNGATARLRAQFSTDSGSYAVQAEFAGGGKGTISENGGSKHDITYLNPITFTDARINGGASTQGYLEVNAFNTSQTLHTIALTRLVFDNASTTLGTGGLSTSATYTTFVAVAVPEPSSFFGLLALGAGGLLARRRSQAA